MKLYYAPASSYSQRALIALYEKNANFIPMEVNLFDSKEREQYMQINPFGKVPTLVTDDNKVFFEACIIIEYLDNKFANKPVLIPVEADLSLEVRLLERMVDIYVNTGREALFADSQRLESERGGKEVAKAKRLMETALTLFDERLKTRTWLLGEQFSLADCAAAPTLNYLRMLYDYNHFSHVTNYIQRLESRSSVAKVFNSGRDQMTRMLSTLKYPLKPLIANC